jgi:hypothetical protein
MPAPAAASKATFGNICVKVSACFISFAFLFLSKVIFFGVFFMIFFYLIFEIVFISLNFQDFAICFFHVFTFHQ